MAITGIMKFPEIYPFVSIRVPELYCLTYSGDGMLSPTFFPCREHSNMGIWFVLRSKPTITNYITTKFGLRLYILAERTC